MKSGGTYAVGDFKLCPEPGIPAFKDRYNIRYPLRERGYNRDKCIEIIRSVGLPVPPKSACFFCPAMRQIEIMRLAKVDPDYYQLAIAMEEMYRDGKHFRGDNQWTVKGKLKSTGIVTEYVCTADDAAAARAAFRQSHDDTASPYKYELNAYPAVPGLGRSFAWSEIPVERTFENVRIRKP